MLYAPLSFGEVVCEKGFIEFTVGSEVSKHTFLFLVAKHQRVVHAMLDLIILGLLYKAVSLYELNGW